MANNTIADGYLVQSAKLQQEYGLIIGDRAALPAHPALAAGYLGLGNEGSTITRTLAGLGTTTASTISETGAVVPTKIDFATMSATPVRKSLARERSDMLKFYDQTGVLKNPAGLALDAAGCRAQTMLAMVCEAAASASVSVGPSSGSALTWAKLREAKQTLIDRGNNFADGELIAVLYPKQWGNLEDQTLAGTSLSPAFTHSAEAYMIQYAKAIGYQGRYFGIDIFTTTRVPAAAGGADSVGALIAPSGIAWAEGQIEPDPDGFMDILDNGRMQIERQRDASRMMKAIYYNFVLGVSLGQDDAVVKIVSDR